MNAAALAPIDWVLFTVSALAVLFAPVAIFVYRRTLERRRLQDLCASFGNEDAIRRYRALFCPPRMDSDRIERIEATISREFLTVHAFRNYLAPVGLLALLLAATVGTIAAWTQWTMDGSMWFSAHFAGMPKQVIFALAGAYVWIVYEIISRIRARELTPNEVLEVSLRLLGAIPIGYACSLIAVDVAKDVVAFAVAAFPLRDVRRFMRERAVKALQVEGSTIGNRTAAGHLANVIDGMSQATLTRLEELQVTTFVDLGYADPVRLMARSGLQLRALLTWMDQALLATYAPALKVKFSELGFPCALDVSEFFERHVKNPSDNDVRSGATTDPTVMKLAEKLDLPPELLVELLREVYIDPHVRFLNAAWYANEVEAQPAVQLAAQQAA